MREHTYFQGYTLFTGDRQTINKGNTVNKYNLPFLRMLNIKA